MKSVIPTMLMIVGIFIMTATAVCFLTFQMQVSAAENLHAESMTRIQASGCDPVEIASCQRDASRLGRNCRLQVIPGSGRNGDGTALVRLTYYADMPIFQLSRKGTVQGCIYC